MGVMIGADVLDELYAADPPDFVATRSRLAKEAREAGDRESAARIGSLRKPGVAAWAVNRLVRDRPVEVEALLDVGRRMREAQSRLDMSRLKELRADRERVLESFTRAARFVADSHGHPLSVDAAAGVRSTAVAALADEAAADAVAGGMLVRTLDYAGFGEVDVSDAVAERVVQASRPASPRGEVEPRTHDDTDRAGDPTDAARGAEAADTEAGEARNPEAEGAATSSAVPSSSSAPSSRGPSSRATSRPGASGRQTSDRKVVQAEASRRRHLARCREELDRTDQELARASLVEAEARRCAEKASRRRDELALLLQTAEQEADAAARAATEATGEREDAARAHAQARAALDAAVAEPSVEGTLGEAPASR